MIIFAVIGAGADFVIRKTVEAHVFNATQRAAVDWIASMRPGLIPEPAETSPEDPSGQVHFLQLVDSHGRVAAASPSAAGMPALSTARPSAHDPIQYLKACSTPGGCVLLTAIRPDPTLLWGGEPHYVYAGVEEPPLLAGHRLGAATLALVLLASAVSAWTMWQVVGRTLRPVAAIREKVSEATVGDASLRLPEPPGDDEIARLARASNRFLDQLEKLMTDQRRFASMVSHELRSPAAALRAQIEEALLYPGEVDPHEALRGALRSTERFQRIIDELLTYTRVKRAVASAPEPVDLTALVRAELGTRPPRGKPVRLHAATERLTVLGTRLHLLGVLSNLLANAQRHAHSQVEVTVVRDGGQAVLIVQDDGDGIAAEDRERVFEPFVRLADGRRRDPGGSGLGLAISREAATTHGGSLTVEDSPRGARFVLRLPLMDAAANPHSGRVQVNGDAGARPQPARA